MGMGYLPNVTLCGTLQLVPFRPIMSSNHAVCFVLRTYRLGSLFADIIKVAEKLSIAIASCK